STWRAPGAETNKPSGAHRSAGTKQSGRLRGFVRPVLGGVAIRDAGLFDLVGQVAPAFRHVQQGGAVSGVIRLFRHQHALSREIVVVAGAFHPGSPLERGLTGPAVFGSTRVPIPNFPTDPGQPTP